eukprot:1154524-Pelagomonas_calceolata.AAC.1
MEWQSYACVHTVTIQRETPSKTSRYVLAYGTQCCTRPFLRHLQEAQDKNKNVTLKELLDAGLINPGEGNVTLSYRGVTYTANLLASGLIEFQGG